MHIKWKIVVTAGVLCAEIWVFRWVVLRMPVVSQQPAWARETHHAEQADRKPSDLAA